MVGKGTVPKTRYTLQFGSKFRTNVRLCAGCALSSHEPLEALLCQGRRIRRHSDAETCTARVGPRKTLTEFHYRDERPAK